MSDRQRSVAVDDTEMRHELAATVAADRPVCALASCLFGSTRVRSRSVLGFEFSPVFFSIRSVPVCRIFFLFSLNSVLINKFSFYASASIPESSVAKSYDNNNNKYRYYYVRRTNLGTRATATVIAIVTAAVPRRPSLGKRYFATLITAVTGI